MCRDIACTSQSATTRRHASRHDAFWGACYRVPRLAERPFARPCGRLSIGVLPRVDSRRNLHGLVIDEALTAVDEVFPLSAAAINYLTPTLRILLRLGLASV